WDATTGRLKSIHGDDAMRGIHGLAISPDGRFIAAVGGLFVKEAVVWDTVSGRIARELDDPAPPPDPPPFLYKGQPTAFRLRSAVAFSPDGRILATAPDGV